MGDQQGSLLKEKPSTTNCSPKRDEAVGTLKGDDIVSTSYESKSCK